MNIQILLTPALACKRIAQEISKLIRCRAAEGGTAVLGLATGKSPLPLYAELVRLHREDGLSFANVVTFNLDEYFGLGREHAESYWRFMHDHLFDHIDLPAEHIHIPCGEISRSEIGAHCTAYEAAIKRAGGIDFQILGIGRTGHIGFNEPGAGRDSRTTLVHLDHRTREDAAVNFGGIEHVPESAITMGCGTILEAREIALMAWGEGKAEIVAEAFCGPVCDEVPASYLQHHRRATIYLDEPAARKLDLEKASTEKQYVLQP